MPNDVMIFVWLKTRWMLNIKEKKEEVKEDQRRVEMLMDLHGTLAVPSGPNPGVGMKF